MANPVIVSAAWVQENLNTPNVRMVDARVSDPRLPMGYKSSHIPGAVPFDLNRDMYEMAPGGARLQAPEAIAKTLGERGIANDSTIVLYDEGTGPLTGSVYWLLKYLGHDDVRVLDGGWQAWQNANAPITKDVPEIQTVAYTPHVDENANSTAEWIQQNSGREDLVLLDTRMDDEFNMGHIPGAVNMSFDEAIDFQTQKLKDFQVLEHQLATIGATPDKEILVYCASGARSSHTFMVLQALGFPRVRNYKGSMHDWSRKLRLPVE